MVTLAVYVQAGSVKETAARMGLAEQTVKNHLGAVYQRLGVGGALEAAQALGWVKVPSSYRMCGWTGICTRLADHRGHHGGFRGVAQARERER